MNKFLKSKTVKAALGLVAVFALVGVYSASAYNFTTVLKMGSKGEAVRELQKALNACSDTMVASTGAGSPGYETSTFAGKTKAAVMKLQAKAGLSQVGQVGPLTRAFLNANGCGTGSTGNTGNTGGTVVSGQITASVASDSPVGLTLAGGSAFNPVLKLRLANGTSSPVNVTGLNLTKTGFMANTYVSGVSVYDAAGMQHGNTVTTLGANGVAIMTFSTSPITVPANGTTDVWVKVNLSSSATSGTIGFSVNASSDIMLSSGSAGGTFPIAGSQMTVVSGTSSLATVTLDEQASACGASGCTLNVDSASSQEIAKFRIQETSSNEDVKLYSLALWNNGNASASDYRDVQLLDQSGTVVATAQPAGNVVKFNLSTPFLIGKGQTKDFTVRATIVSGSTRTIQFTVYNDYDLDVRGVSTAVSILPSAGSNDSSFPIGDTSATYNKATVGTGSLTFSRASDSATGSVAPGTEVSLAKFNAKPTGEDMEVRGISFGITQNNANKLTGTVYVKVNGQIVYSAAGTVANFATAGGNTVTRSLSSYPILTAGVNNTIEVVASIDSSATSSSTFKVNQFDVTSVKRLISNDITDPSVGAQDGVSLSAQAGNLNVTNLSTPVASSVVTGTSGIELANIELSAGSSGEDVRVSTITIGDQKSVTAAYSDFANLVLKDSTGSALATTSSTATNASTVAFNFSSPIIVAKNASTVLKLYGDLIGGTATYTHTFTATAVTATGKTTGNTISVSPAGSGQTMTITSGGTLAMSTVSGTGATPSNPQLTNINATDGVYLAWKWTSQYEAQKITSLKLKATGTSLNQNNVKNIRLYAKKGSYTSFQSDATQFAYVGQFSTCSSNVCSFTWTDGSNVLPFTIDPGMGVTVWVKADLQGENVAKLGDDFYMSVTNDGTDVAAKGSITGATTSTMTGSSGISTAATHINPFQVLVTGESPTSGSTTQSSIGAGTQIGRFKVMNNGSAQITLTDATFTNSGSHTNTNARYTVYASSENSNDYTTNSLEVSGTDTVAFGSLTTSVTINGGSYRYITVAVTTTTSLASGDTYSLSVGALGDLKYSVAESALGYDGEQDGDLTGTITGLYVDGKPAVGTVQKQ